MSGYDLISVEPISAALGAVIRGVNCGSELSQAVIDEVRAAWLQYLVVFFPEQSVTPEQQLAFSRRFGQPVEYPMIQGLQGTPEVVAVVKLPHEKQNFGGIWHSDTTYLPSPPIGALLLARELPPVGGDTLFANMYMAYETLSVGLKQVLSGLRVVQSSAKAGAARSRVDRIKATSVPEPEVLEAEHAVVRVHPETGRKALFINRPYTLHFEGMTVEESMPLLDFLFSHAERPEFTCRVHWENNTLGLWDNRVTMHCAIDDDFQARKGEPGCRRIVHRATMAGERLS